jgi:iron complex outermembrane receptor protein
LSSVLAGAPVKKDTRQVQAEQIDAVEAGYRGKIGRFVVDVSAYYNSYTNFNAAELKWFRCTEQQVTINFLC